MCRPTVLRYSNECSDTNCNAPDFQTMYFFEKQFKIKAGVPIVVSTHYIQFSLHYITGYKLYNQKEKVEDWKDCQTATTKELQVPYNVREETLQLPPESPATDFHPDPRKCPSPC